MPRHDDSIHESTKRSSLSFENAFLCIFRCFTEFRVLQSLQKVDCAVHGVHGQLGGTSAATGRLLFCGDMSREAVEVMLES